MPPDAPTVSHPIVYHVGDLDAARDKSRYSNEGTALSVSLHPDAWRQIARDVSGTTYELHNPGAVFYEADPTGPRDDILDWIVDNGYAERVTGWRGEWHDPAIDETRYVLSYDEEHARVESQADVRADAHVEETTVLKLANRGRDYWEEAFTLSPDEAGPLHVRQLAPVWYACNALDVDGVWWPERLDPANHSAPRGAIFQDVLDKWTVTEGDVQ